ncbi:class I SAM-dependent methyltransferase [Mycolicibacterium stellerae]|uniref:class I SAM-dependent methyltransferase n=1 Tax=Mycolicibacterium stellerae TaxID=2358193 RepID=UPI000F0B8FCE|nr:class I SAM-dependent methyltransferase [Mycolicibacterium stellerae]
MGIATTGLSAIEQTAFLTEYARALDSQWPRPILGDALAHEVVGNIDYDFAGLGVQTSVVCQTALRAKMLDDRVRAFVSEHPDAVVVDLGAGLDSGYYRVGPPPTVHWYSVDLPGITALRDQVLPAVPQSHSVPVSLADEHWPDAIPADRPTMLVADGLFAFLTEPVIIGIFRRITDHFGSGRLAFNDYGRIGWASRLAIKLYPQKMFKDVGSQFGYPGFKDAHHPETWNPRMRLVEEASLTDAQEVDLFPGWIRVATKLSAMSKTARRKARILVYAF